MAENQGIILPPTSSVIPIPPRLLDCWIAGLLLLLKDFYGSR
ncbi:hypothetical protein [Okeania sp.]|nr:hypothetical protein [Okeania sp.]